MRTELLVQQKDESLAVYNVASQSITNRFPVVANTRCIALGPRQESATVVHEDGRLETWDLKVFAPDGSVNLGVPTPAQSLIRKISGRTSSPGVQSQ
jgi:hypothetical protein